MNKVLLIFGGISYEHDVSIVTASQIFAKTRLIDFKLVPFYISRKGRFYVYQKEEFCLADFANFKEEKPSKCFKEAVFVSGEKGKVFAKTRFGLREMLETNLAINACHGGNGEDGKLVANLEFMGIFCASGGVEALGISMNKMLFKTLMRGAKLPVVSGFEIIESEYEKDKSIYENRLKFAKFPLVLKPVSGGSSIGLFVAKTRAEFEKMLLEAFEFDSHILVENFVEKAREFNVAVIGDEDKIEVSEVDEPLKLSEILSFEDKYLSGEKSAKGIKSGSLMESQKRNFPAKISAGLRDKLKNTAAEVFKTLKLSGVVRIDFLYDELKDKIYICEVNSVPGSLAFYFFARGEVLINEFVLKLISLAEKKSKAENLIKQEFITNLLK